ncbi:MAG TPA: GNAT family N-acetyltransferase, partial [Microvirga sp.]|nr:GNAT family N-acetyltransferase [Microvirga sp.]
DHRNDATVLERWLANKTPENVASWIAHRDSYVFVAAEAGTILGVGAVTSSGEITLNYVSPDARFRGVSRALLERLEATARALGNERCTLTSTETARRFYLAAGYLEQGSPRCGFGSSLSHPMAKQLAVPCRGEAASPMS